MLTAVLAGDRLLEDEAGTDELAPHPLMMTATSTAAAAQPP